jgi:hypothetical protein
MRKRGEELCGPERLKEKSAEIRDPWPLFSLPRSNKHGAVRTMWIIGGEDARPGGNGSSVHVKISFNRSTR